MSKLSRAVVNVNRNLSALNSLGASLSCLVDAAEALKRILRDYDIQFDYDREFRGLTPKGSKRDAPKITYLATHEKCLAAQDQCRFIPEWVGHLRKSQEEAMRAICELPDSLEDSLSRSLGKDWQPTVRRELLDSVLVWPGETMTFRALGSRKVPDRFHEFVENIKVHDPTERWREYERRIDDFRSYLEALEGSPLLRGPSTNPQGDDKSQGKLYTPKKMRQATGLGSTAFNDYAKRAKVETPRRGKKNFQYPEPAAKIVFQYIIENCQDESVIRKCQEALK